MYGRNVKPEASFFWMRGFLVLFTVGGLTGLILSRASMDVRIHDSYYVVAHFHYTLSIGVVFSIFGGFVHFFHFFTGVTLPSRLLVSHFFISFIGVNFTFFPMHFVGLMGMPRRYFEYVDAFEFVNELCSFGSLLSLGGLRLFCFLVWESFVSSRPCVFWFFKGVIVSVFTLFPVGGHTFKEFSVLCDLSQTVNNKFQFFGLFVFGV